MQKSIVRVVGSVALLLLVPLFANHNIEGWNWSPLDFAAAATLLLIAGTALEIVFKKVDTKYRLIAGVGVVLLFLVIWADLAVGVFNIPGFSGS